MRHEWRRKKLGAMLIDVSKYFLTAGLLGGFFVEKLTPLIGLGILGIAVIAAIVGFFIIPERRSDDL
jgi:hypothetical protein